MDIYDKYPDLKDNSFVAEYDLATGYTRSNPEDAVSEFEAGIALIRVKGNLALAAKSLGRSRRALEGFVGRNTLLSDLLQDIDDEFLDTVEDLYKCAALNGDDTAQRFFLTTKGKERGYVTRLEGTGKNGGPVTVQFNGNDANL